MKSEKNGITINGSLNKNPDTGGYLDKQVGDRYKCTTCDYTILTSFGDVTYDKDDRHPVDVEVSGGSWGELE